MSKMKKTKERKVGKYGSAKERADNHRGGFTSQAVKIPEGMTLFKPSSKPGVHKIDIVPYVVGQGNQLMDEGSWWYERTFHVHNNVGPKKDRFVCPAMTFNKRCPICETRARLQRTSGTTKEQLKACNTSERQLFLVKEYDPKTNEPGDTQLWDMSFHLFGKLLDDRIRKGDEDDDLGSFFHLKGGKTLKIGVEDKTMGDGGKPFANINSIDFKPRKTKYDQSMLDDNPCLDDLLIETSYADLKAAWNAGIVEDEEDDDDKDEKDTEEEDDEDDKPAKKKKKKGKEDDDDDDDDTTDDEDEDTDEDEDDTDGDDEDDDKSDDDEDDDGDSDDDDDSDDGDGDDEEDDDEDDEDGEEGDEDEDESDDDAGDEGGKVDGVFSVGDKVTWTYKKKVKKGKVVKVNLKTKILLVRVAGQDAKSSVGFDEVETVNGKPPKKGKTGKKKHDLEEDEDDDFFDDEDEDEEEEVKPKKKKKKGK